MQADAKSLAFLRVCFGYVSGSASGSASRSASGSASGVPHIPLPFRWWTPQKCIHPYLAYPKRDHNFDNHPFELGSM